MVKTKYQTIVCHDLHSLEEFGLKLPLALEYDNTGRQASKTFRFQRE